MEEIEPNNKSKEKVEEKVETKESLYEVRDRVVETQPVIAKGDDIMTLEEALATLLNKIDSLEKAIKG